MLADNLISITPRQMYGERVKLYLKYVITIQSGYVYISVRGLLFIQSVAFHEGSQVFLYEKRSLSFVEE